MRAHRPQALLVAATCFIALATASAADPPYPPSPVFQNTILATQSAPLTGGTDNWPLTWSSDESGQGELGKQASGMLAIDGRIYIWIPGKSNAQLAWSDDHGVNWTLAPWQFTTSFGFPTFLNFGKDYAGARDNYVYIYSHDHHSANEPADRMVLARVPKDHIVKREAYEFFGAIEDQPYWVQNAEERAAVFTSRGRCYHSSISYHAPTRRYLWVQILPAKDSQTGAGFGIYDAPEPWGPWTTVFYTEKWDAPLGDNAFLPTQWMSPDGGAAELIFSSAGVFTRRRIEFQIKPQ